MLLLRGHAARRRPGLLRLRVPHRLVDREDDARRLGRGRVRVDLIDGGLPDVGDHGVGGPLGVEVHPHPLALPPRQGVLGPQLLQHVGRVEPGVLAELPGDHLEGLGEGVDDVLLLARDGAGLEAQRVGDLHLDGPAAGHHLPPHQPALHDAQGVVDRPVGLFDELLRATAEDDGGRLGLGAARENVEALVPNLVLGEVSGEAEDVLGEVVDRALDLAARGLGDAVQVRSLHPPRAKEASVGEVLSGEVADGEFGEDDLGPALDAVVQLLVNDLPLRVHDRLVHGRVRDANLGVLLFRLEFELHVEEQNLGVLEHLFHLLEARV
mmetsp:Transcript_40927/g.92111  ORF Transcript_40927/g.92111 Transcript_40927/m.92111 type:complete len:324 (+) Transcript_40927:144-1115(+)